MSPMRAIWVLDSAKARVGLQWVQGPWGPIKGLTYPGSQAL